MRYLTFRLLEQFVEFYYNTFDENRTQLAPLYVRNRVSDSRD
jgi:hypothetical protein